METDQGGKVCLETDPLTVRLETSEETQMFTFDHVFQAQDTQQIVFERVAEPVVKGMLFCTMHCTYPA